MIVKTGKGNISLLTLLAIWSVSALCSLPGLAVSPILGDLQHIFPQASELDIQLLTSLPSLFIIPSVLLSGTLTQKIDGRLVLQAGLLLFFVSGVLYLLSDTMEELLLVSILLGVGSGVIVPLSTGLISRYFIGRYRTQQFGYSSAINNLTLVVCTSLTGWLAEVNWHLPFVVYLFPVVSLILTYYLQAPDGNSNVADEADDQTRQQLLQRRQQLTDRYPSYARWGIALPPLITLMCFYGLITYLVIIVSFNLPFIMTEYGLSSERSGLMISGFFLAMMIPGFFINQIVARLGRTTKLWCLVGIFIGLLLVIVSRNELFIAIGCLLMGGGYGVAQPLVYDQTAQIAVSRRVTLALAFVMAMNYVAILLCPFIVDGLQSLLSVRSQAFAFWLNALVTLALIGWSVIHYSNYLFNENDAK